MVRLHQVRERLLHFQKWKLKHLIQVFYIETFRLLKNDINLESANDIKNIEIYK